MLGNIKGGLQRDNRAALQIANGSLNVEWFIIQRSRGCFSQLPEHENETCISRWNKIDWSNWSVRIISEKRSHKFARWIAKVHYTYSPKTSEFCSMQKDEFDELWQTWNAWKKFCDPSESNPVILVGGAHILVHGTYSAPNVNRSELGNADNAIPIGVRCIWNGSKKKKCAVHEGRQAERERKQEIRWEEGRQFPSRRNAIERVLV